MDTLTPLTQLLITPPGNLTYHLVILFAIGGALQAAWAQWQRAAYPQTRRLLQGLGVLFVARLVLFALGGLAWQKMLSAHLVLPIADRAVMALTLALFIWMWGFPEHHRSGDRALGLILALIAVLTVTSALLWPQYSALPFNHSPIDQVWNALGLVLGLGGIFILARRRPNGVSAGITAMGILTLGQLVHALAAPPGDLDSYLRFADLLAYPLLFTLPYRFGVQKQDAVRAVHIHQPASAPAPAAEVPKALLALLNTDPNDPEACVRLAKAVALWLKADLCLVMTPPRNDRINVACAYDLIREQALSGLSVEANRLPIVSAAMEKRRPLRLPASSTSVDVRTLAQALNLKRTGPILATPLASDDGEFPLQGGLVLLSPYAQHSWTGEEQELLALLGRHLGRWLAQGSRTSALQQAQAEASAQAEALAAQNQALQERLAEHEALEERLHAVAAAYEDALRQIEHLEDEKRQLLSAQTALETRLAALEAETAEETEDAAEASSEEPSEAETDGVAVTDETDALPQLFAAQREIEQLRASLWRAREEAKNRDQNLQVLLSIAQDLRQPLAALSGYADLLLSESVGILGALQRQFVERIRANAARLGQAIDNIVHLLAMDANDFTLRLQEVRLDEIVDLAIARNTNLLREKRLLLRVDLPDPLPTVRLDKEMLHQVVHYLLRNAALASPEESEILLRLRLDEESEEGEPLLLLEIRDSGGGIAAEDIPKVFSRRYRTAYRIIDGLGDNGLGLPLAKALIDAMDGRIWVENQGNGAVFTVLLPLPNEQPVPVESG